MELGNLKTQGFAQKRAQIFPRAMIHCCLYVCARLHPFPRTVHGRGNRTSAVLSSPLQPQILMLPLGCAFGAGPVDKNQTLTQRKLDRALCNIEIWGLRVYLVGVCMVWSFCPSTVVKWMKSNAWTFYMLKSLHSVIYQLSMKNALCSVQFAHACSRPDLLRRNPRNPRKQVV